MSDRNTVTTEKALKIRKRVKDHKPSFVRPESWRYVRLKENWRRPRGLDHKMRRKIKGWPATVNTGYRGPKIARGLHPSGYVEVLVYNADQVQGIDPKTQAIRIAHTVGMRKRVRIMTEARKRNITILNVKEVKKAPAEEKELAEDKLEEEGQTEEAEEQAEKETKKKKPQKPKKTRKSEEETGGQ